MSNDTHFNFDETQALNEGWAIFWVTGTSQPGDYQIQYDHEARLLKTDDDAWTLVLRRAGLEKSEYHLAALYFLAVHSPEEYIRILRHGVETHEPVAVLEVIRTVGEMVREWEKTL